MPAEDGRITVSRDALRAELAEMELRLLQKLATKSEVDALTSRITVLEIHGSPNAQALQKKVIESESRIRSLEDARAEQTGERGYKRFLWPSVAALLAASWWIPPVLLHTNHL